MNIKLITLTLTNFKGIRSTTIPFNGTNKEIIGDNGTGKTTIFDAFLWLLFGKDSQDRADFEIKTLDRNNNPIEKIPHEVEAVLVLDGKPTNFKRCYEEKWTTKRGSATEEFTGHQTKYWIDDIALSQKDYEQKISTLICEEQLFKLITNPFYFPSIKKDAARQRLFNLAGGVSDADIAQQDDRFKQLLERASGKNLEDYKKQIVTRKKAVKEALQGLPERIDENKRSQPPVKDWVSIKASIEQKELAIKNIDKQMVDKSTVSKEKVEKRTDIQKRIGELQAQCMGRSNQITIEVEKEYSQRQLEISQQERKRDVLNSKKEALSTEQEELAKKSNTLADKIETMIAGWKVIKQTELDFCTDDFICPTCKQPLDASDIDSKKDELVKNFNSKKAEDLKKNQEDGERLKKEKDEVQKRTDEVKQELLKIDEELSKIIIPEQIEKPDSVKLIDKDVQIKNYEKRIAELQAEFDSINVDEVDLSDLQKQKSDNQESLDTLKADYAVKQQVEATQDRIKELEESHKTNSQELATLEQEEFLIAEFSKAKVETVESKINSLFSLVKFKMYESQINGGELETCIPMVNGVPFSSLNNAMRINAGLDIINAFCSHEDIYAPIFIDNAESINELISTKSQMVRLVVTTDKQLKIS